VNERERLLEKVAQGPKSVRFDTLVKLMELWDFEATYGKKGDFVMFRHKVYRVQASTAKPHHDPVLSVYVKNCLKAIENVCIQEEGTDA
jgi:hypothetical protein